MSFTIYTALRESHNLHMMRNCFKTSDMMSQPSGIFINVGQYQSGFVSLERLLLYKLSVISFPLLEEECLKVSVSHSKEEEDVM